MINFIQVLILGFVQGVSELLPVSGSAHQRLLEVLFGISDSGFSNGLLKPMLHLGVLIAVAISLRRQFARMFRGLTGLFGGDEIIDERGRKRRTNASGKNRRMLVLVLSASLPLFVLPFFRSRFAGLNENLFFIGAMLLVSAVVVYLTRRIGFGDSRIEDMSVADAALVGLSQIPSALTGVSRSGLTMATGLWRGLDPMAAIDFSYLISAPALFGMTILEFIDIDTSVSWGMVPEALAAMAAAAMGGYLAIRLVRFVFRRNAFPKFAYYCFGAGVIVLLLALAYI